MVVTDEVFEFPEDTTTPLLEIQREMNCLNKRYVPTNSQFFTDNCAEMLAFVDKCFAQFPNIIKPIRYVPENITTILNSYKCVKQSLKINYSAFNAFTAADNITDHSVA